MNNGFIKLYRCLEESFIWSDSEAVHLWIQLLINANHKEKEVLLSGNKVIIKSGQFVCSRKTLSLKTGINESKIQRLLTLFKSEQMIEQQTNSKYRIITVLNWNKYQSGEQVIEQQMNSKRTANEQQVNTNKNDKNEKKEEKDTIVSKKKVDYPDDFEKLWKEYPRPQKGSKPVASKEWKKLSQEEKTDAYNALVNYKESVSDLKYLAHCERYLKNKLWLGFEIQELPKQKTLVYKNPEAVANE